MNNSLSFITAISPWLIVKIFFLLILILYLGLALIIIRQVELMNQVLEAKFSPTIRLIALIHLILVIILFFLALLVL